MKKRYLWIFVAIALLVLFFRKPDTILHPQFWAEDGRVWFASAYNFGIGSLFSVQDGYFQTLSRLTALFSLFFPLQFSPLIFNIVALCIQVLPAVFLASSRFEKLFTTHIRLFIASLYLLLPNTAEVHGNLTNAMWFLAITAFMVVVAPENRQKSWKIFDILVLVLAGLSGPFSILLLPIAFVFWFFQKTNNSRRNLIILTLCAVVQLCGIFILGDGSRVGGGLDLSPRLIFAIFSRQVVWGALIGTHGYSWILSNLSWYFYFFAITTTISLFLIAYTAIKAPLWLRLFLLFGGFIFTASLISPTGDFSTMSPLKLLSRSSDGARYWLIPMLSFLAVLIWNVKMGQVKIIKFLSGILLSLMFFGIALDFRHKEFTDFQFKKYLKEFQGIPQGQAISIPINPKGWDMVLIKK